MSDIISFQNRRQVRDFLDKFAACSGCGWVPRSQFKERLVINEHGNQMLADTCSACGRRRVNRIL